MRVPRFIATGLTLVALSLCSAAAIMVTASPASAAASTTVMKTGQKLLPGHAVRSAEVVDGCNSYYWELRLQSNGNLVERKILPCRGDQQVTWQTPTSKPAYLLLNGIGDLVLVNTSGNRVWQTDTGGLGVTHLAIGADGNMQMLTASGAAKWSSRWALCSKAAISNGRASTIVSTACRAQGTPYCLDAGSWSGPTNYCPSTRVTYKKPHIDCSGLTMYAVYQATYQKLDHYAYNQDQSNVSKFKATRVARSNLQPGDLVFFWGADSPHPGHVGIYLGNNDLIDAFDTGYPVAIHSFSWENTYGSHRPGYSSNYMGAVRYW